jgi:hypothetical protein
MKDPGLRLEATETQRACGVPAQSMQLESGFHRCGNPGAEQAELGQGHTGVDGRAGPWPNQRGEAVLSAPRELVTRLLET